MDVGSIIGALTGGGGVQMEIRFQPPAQPSENMLVVPMDHYPSWKLHKNPFWRVQHPSGSSKLAIAQHQQQQQQQQLQQQQQQQQQQVGGMPLQQQQQQPPMMGGGMGQPEYAGVPPPSMSSPAMMSPATANAFVGGPAMKEVIYAYEASQDVEGSVILRIPPGKKTEHLGIKVQFIGRIDMSVGIHEGRPHYDFVSLSKELAPPGTLFYPETVLPFKFKNMDKEFESYRGRNVSVRYFVRVLMERKFLPALTKDNDVWVQLMGQEPGAHEAIKMEVGIEDCLHIEFEYERRHYHLQDTIRGKIHFLLVRIKIKHMELAVIRRETSGEGVAAAAAASEGGSAANRGAAGGGPPGGNNPMSGGGNAPPLPGSSNNNNNNAAVDANNIFTETQTLVKYEIMDGAPVKGEVIPVKLALKGIPADLTPTYTAVNNRFSVRYFLNLVLVDEDDRRYFKQQEIILWRKELG